MTLTERPCWNKRNGERHKNKDPPRHLDPKVKQTWILASWVATRTSFRPSPLRSATIGGGKRSASYLIGYSSDKWYHASLNEKSPSCCQVGFQRCKEIGQQSTITFPREVKHGQILRILKVGHLKREENGEGGEHENGQISLPHRGSILLSCWSDSID